MNTTTSKPEPTHDLIVIGAGQAGPFLAATLVNKGWRVALIEKKDLGGTCVNRGCTPTKTLRKSAVVANWARRAQEFGVNINDILIDFERAMTRMQQRVDESRAGLEQWLNGLAGLSVIRGAGRLMGKHKSNDRSDLFLVEVAGQVLCAPKVVLNTGTRPFVPPIDGLKEVPHLTNEELLQLRACPARLLVVGGSYIGLEMGQIFQRLGSQVVIVEPGAHLIQREDEDVSTMIQSMLEKEGLQVHCGQAVQRVEKSINDSVQLILADGQVLSGTHLLLATGRTPNTQDLGLDTVGLTTNARGLITTNDRLETAVPGIWALGDINGRGAFTHTSYQDHEIVATNLLFPDDPSLQRDAAHRPNLYAMFTDPPLAHVGLYERDAKALVAAGRRISQAVFHMGNVSRAKEESELEGVIKLLLDEDSGAILGATMLGMNADEIVQSLNLVMACGGTWMQVRDALPIHPTITEFFPTIIHRRSLLRV